MANMSIMAMDYTLKFNWLEVPIRENPNNTIRP